MSFSSVASEKVWSSCWWAVHWLLKRPCIFNGSLVRWRQYMLIDVSNIDLIVKRWHWKMILLTGVHICQMTNPLQTNLCFCWTVPDSSGGLLRNQNKMIELTAIRRCHLNPLSCRALRSALKWPRACLARLAMVESGQVRS